MEKSYKKGRFQDFYDQETSWRKQDFKREKFNLSEHIEQEEIDDPKILNLLGEN